MVNRIEIVVDLLAIKRLNVGVENTVVKPDSCVGGVQFLDICVFTFDHSCLFETRL